jgi:hypothetical protein
MLSSSSRNKENVKVYKGLNYTDDDKQCRDKREEEEISEITTNEAF